MKLHGPSRWSSNTCLGQTLSERQLVSLETNLYFPYLILSEMRTRTDGGKTPVTDHANTQTDILEWELHHDGGSSRERFRARCDQ